jgi:hypothetical protein
MRPSPKVKHFRLPAPCGCLRPQAEFLKCTEDDRAYREGSSPGALLRSSSNMSRRLPINRPPGTGLGHLSSGKQERGQRKNRSTWIFADVKDALFFWVARWLAVLSMWACSINRNTVASRSTSPRRKRLARPCLLSFSAVLHFWSSHAYAQSSHQDHRQKT